MTQPPIESRPDPEWSSRGGAKVRAAVIHTAEGMSFDGVVGYLQRPGNSVSSHYVVAAEPSVPGAKWARVARMVPEDKAAWTARSANATTVNYELCGYARQTRREWLGPRRTQLVTVAALVANDIAEYRLPVKRGYPGILGHGDLTQAGFPQTHWDPGPGFPWDVFLAMVRDHDMQARPPVGDKPAGPIGRPANAPERIPRWAWQLHEWLLTPPAKRGKRPANAPVKVPGWYWQWRRWRMGIPPDDSGDLLGRD